ncbi:MAG: hypothetical protein K2Q06_00195 [Parvularculaceae bacterium]|nr:hypothetical protein [Parvularculaceae bacterium]
MVSEGGKGRRRGGGRTLWLALASTLAPSAAAVLSAALYAKIYGAPPHRYFVIELYAGFFLVGNFLVAPLFAEARRGGLVALLLAAVAAAAVTATPAARELFNIWPPTPLQRDLAFLAGSGVVAMLCFWLASKLT